MLLSLLYDEVSAQDETFLCSRRMTRWFRDQKDFRLLEELFECRGLRVLKRPWEKYPKELKDEAWEKTITARRKHLTDFSVENNGKPLHFSKAQVEFHKNLENLLLNHEAYHRYAGSKKKPGQDVMREFATLLELVLTDRRYKKWLKRNFGSITPRVADDFVRFIHDPASAIDYLKKARAGLSPRFTPQAGGPPFSTALAVQLAATYRNEAKELQDLIETVFAKPFCQEEQADGRYGPLLRDLPIPLEGVETEGGMGRIFSVEVKVKVPLILPLPSPNFSKVINEVRESRNGRNLRNAMSLLSDDLTFANATSAWKHVAADLASTVPSANKKEIGLCMAVSRIVKDTVYGTIVDFLLSPPTTLQEGIVRIGKSALPPVSSFGGDLVSELRGAYLERQSISRDLEKAVEFSCVRHPTVKGDKQGEEK
jgi:hypothetical protein